MMGDFCFRLEVKDWVKQFGMKIGNIESDTALSGHLGEVHRQACVLF